MDRNAGDFSVLVSETLDSLGYNRAIVQQRQASWRWYASNNSKELRKNGDFGYIHAGSKGEGMSSFHESDLDIMVVDDHVVCAEVPNPHLGKGNKTTFQTDTEHCPPGYTRLKLIRLPVGDRFVHKDTKLLINALVRDETDRKCLSSDLYFDMIVTNRPQRHLLPRQGPSSPSQGLGIAQDLVYSFVCHCPSILTAWLRRRRSHNWPAGPVIRKIANMESHVVPVGFKHSCNRTLEWRICYTLAELTLIHNFTDAQTKVYVLLKLMSKSVLKHFSDAITSYLMKNIIFWISELNPPSSFTDSTLIDRLVQCFVLLRVFVRCKCVPNYMIPARNLLLGKLNNQRRARLLTVLDEIIDDGGSMLLRCDKLRNGLLLMYKEPEVAKEEGRRRDGVERMQIMQSTAGRHFMLTPVVNMPSLIYSVQANGGKLRDCVVSRMLVMYA